MVQQESDLKKGRGLRLRAHRRPSRRSRRLRRESHCQHLRLLLLLLLLLSQDFAGCIALVGEDV